MISIVIHLLLLPLIVLFSSAVDIKGTNIADHIKGTAADDDIRGHITEMISLDGLEG